MYIHVRVRAGAKKEEFSVVGENRFAAAVREEAKGNRANRRVVELIAAHLHTVPGKIRIVSGHHHPSKILSVEDID